MQNLIQFIEGKTNKKINFFEYNNQSISKNQNVVTFNDKAYVIEFIEDITIDNIKGYFYIFYQQDCELDNLKGILYNLYDNIKLFLYENLLILNSDYKLDINFHTPEIIESETYRNTYIINLGEIYDINIFKSRVSIFNEIPKDFLINNTFFKNYITLKDLIIYKSIYFIKHDRSFYDLIDFESIKTMDINLLNTGICFIENSQNISKTSSSLFLHRNTLIYRLDKIKEILNLDLKNFKDALIFYLTIKSYINFK